MDSILCFFIRQDLQDIGDSFLPAARRPSAEGRYILTILLILPAASFKIRIHSSFCGIVLFKKLKCYKNGMLDD
jgi:hypothetical protein